MTTYTQKDLTLSATSYFYNSVNNLPQLSDLVFSALVAAQQDLLQLQAKWTALITQLTGLTDPVYGPPLTAAQKSLAAINAELETIQSRVAGN